MATTTNISPYEFLKNLNTNYCLQTVVDTKLLPNKSKINVTFIEKTKYEQLLFKVTDKNYVVSIGYCLLTGKYYSSWHYDNSYYEKTFYKKNTEDETELERMERYKYEYKCYLLNHTITVVKLIYRDNYKLIVMLIHNKYLSDNSNSINANKVLGNKHLMRYIASYLDNGNGN
jgi:hypothetical protein